MMESMSKRILAGLLTVCFLVVQVIGSVVALEIEHVHHDHHGHDFAGFHVSSGSDAESHHHHNHPPTGGHGEDDEPKDDQPEDDSPATPHSHALSVNTAFALADQVFFADDPGHDLPKRGIHTENEICPDGPSFEVTKPPQIA